MGHPAVRRGACVHQRRFAGALKLASRPSQSPDLVHYWCRVESAGLGILLCRGGPRNSYCVQYTVYSRVLCIDSVY